MQAGFHVVLALVTAITLTLQAPANAKESFRIFDATYFKNKPDLARYGIEKIHIVYAGELWARGTARSEISELHARNTARRITKGTQVIVIDVEHWPVFRAPEDEIALSVKKYLQLFDIFRSANPSSSIGFYGLLPVRQYWIPVRGGTDEKAEWYAANTRLTAIAENVDAVYPSLYTFYSDEKGWIEYAKANLEQARGYGKPVYAFLWPRFHDSNKLLGGQPVPQAYWRKQLELVRDYADGVVIWDSARTTWNDDAEWWKATLDFIGSMTVNDR